MSFIAEVRRKGRKPFENFKVTIKTNKSRDNTPSLSDSDDDKKKSKSKGKRLFKEPRVFLLRYLVTPTTWMKIYAFFLLFFRLFADTVKTPTFWSTFAATPQRVALFSFSQQNYIIAPVI